MNTFSTDEQRFILKCAWEGVFLPDPCVYCNGLSQHKYYCPLENSE